MAVRIAHISDCYLPRTGGIEVQVRGLSQAQRAAGQSPMVVTATPAARGRAVVAGELDEGVPVHRLALDLPGGLPVTHHVGGRLRDLLTDGADVAHIHGGLVSPFAWPALATAVRSGTPCVVSVHSMWEGWTGAIRAAGKVVGVRDWPVVWTTVSQVAAQSLGRALGPDADVRVLPNGIDIATWQPQQVPVRPDPVFTVVAVTRLAMRKRAGALLDILAQAREQVPGNIAMRAILVGDGPDRGRIERAIHSHGLDWVSCAGWRSHAEIREVFAGSDVFLSAARLESFGIAALEARTFGLPVVGLSSAGIVEFITHEQEGLLAEDDAGLAAAVARLATDPELLESISRHNRTQPPKFGWPGVVDRGAEQYRDAIALV